MSVSHESIRNGEENESIIDERDNGSRGDIVFQSGIKTVVGGTDVDSGYSASDSDACCKDSEPHKSEEADDILVTVEHGTQAEEEK